MAAAETRRKRILFVDDEPEFLETIAAVIDSTQKELWEPWFAESAGQALSILQERPMNLVVIDIEMPVVDGVQFLSLINRKHPNLSKVVLTGFATEEHRIACLSGGAELFLEKPRTPRDLQSILATLHELARLQPEEGFRGVLRRVGLTDIIQMECLSRHSVVLHVATTSGHGEIYIKDGSIIHAECADLEGEAAFNRVLGMKGGEFDLRAFQEPPRQSIEGQWEFLLMEAARQMDEMAKGVTEAGGDPVSTSTWDRADLAALPNLFLALGTVTGGEPSPVAVQDREGSKTSVPEPASSAEDRPTRVDEILVCSPQGDVIYEWQCQDAAGRIRFLEFLSQKRRPFHATLGFGALDRLEVLSARAKVVAPLQADCGVFVRTSKAAAQEEEPRPQTLRWSSS